MLGGLAVGLIHDNVKRNNLKLPKPDSEDKIVDAIANVIDLVGGKKISDERPETLNTENPRQHMRAL